MGDTSNTTPAGPYDFDARQAHLKLAEEALEREAYQKLLDAYADLLSRGVAAVGYHSVCTEILEMARSLTDASLQFDEDAKEYELKRLRVQRICENPFNEARAAESLGLIVRRIDGTHDWIRRWPQSKRLWQDSGRQHWDDLCQSEKHWVTRKLDQEYSKRRAGFELDAEAIRGSADSRNAESKECHLAVAVKKGQDGLVLSSDGLPPFSISAEVTELFKLFVTKIVFGSSGECVEFEKLNFAVKVETAPEDREKASGLLRTAISRLNKELSNWSALPNGESWIKNSRGTGYQLNERVSWSIDDNDSHSELKRYSASVYGLTTRDSSLEENTPARGQKLPSQPRRDKTADY